MSKPSPPNSDARNGEFVEPLSETLEELQAAIERFESAQSQFPTDLVPVYPEDAYALDLVREFAHGVQESLSQHVTPDGEYETPAGFKNLLEYQEWRDGQKVTDATGEAPADLPHFQEVVLGLTNTSISALSVAEEELANGTIQLSVHADDTWEPYKFLPEAWREAEKVTWGDDIFPFEIVITQERPAEIATSVLYRDEETAAEEGEDVIPALGGLHYLSYLVWLYINSDQVESVGTD